MIFLLIKSFIDEHNLILVISTDEFKHSVFDSAWAD